ncbi:hypothetical protein CJF30_00002047 [Rutstroemia sp. NJR-2017a BBW]|nr:hypothetical protein CJF30_00002047 [Rutstroemia sp. NJR-2017a BBW]
MYTEPGEIMETDQSEEASGTGGVPNLPPRPLNVQERLIAIASTCGIRASDVQDSFGKQLSYIEDRYPRDTLQWQQWLAGSKVWEANFPQKGSYPFPEPARPYALVSTNIFSSRSQPPTGPRYHTDSTRREGRSIDDKGTRGPSRRIMSRSRSPVRSRKSGSGRDSRRHRSRSREQYVNKYTNRPEGSKSSRGAVQVSSTGNGGGSAVKSNLKLEFATGPHPIKPSGYRTNESTMEKKAVLLNCRREFFVCLQKNRDLAKKQHRDCDQNYRGWLADRLTWQTMLTVAFML